MYIDSTDILNKLAYESVDYTSNTRIRKQQDLALLLMKIAYH